MFVSIKSDATYRAILRWLLSTFVLTAFVASGESMNEFDGVNPGPWISYEKTESEPWRTQAGIVKFFEFVVPIEGMSPRSFHIYWQKHHSPHVMNITEFSQFMKKYNTGHMLRMDQAVMPPAITQDHAFVGAAEVWLSSLSDVSVWLGKSVYEDLIQPDEPRFIAQDGSAEIMVGKEQRVLEASADMPEQNLPKLYLLVGKASSSSEEDFHSGVARAAEALIAVPEARAMLHQVVVTHKLMGDLPDGLGGGSIDAVMELWFADMESAAKLIASEAFIDCVGSLSVAEKPMRAFLARMHVVHDEFSFQPSVTQPIYFRLE